MKKYAYQKFLLNCDYESIQLSDVPSFDENIEEVLDYRYEYCLFDVGKEVIRKIDVAELDDQIDTKEDWELLVTALRRVDSVILFNYNVDSSNPIVCNYREATLKAYLYRLQQNHQKLFLAEKNTVRIFCDYQER